MPIGIVPKRDEVGRENSLTVGHAPRRRPEPFLEAEGQGGEVVEGGGTVSHEEGLNLLGESVLIGAPEGGHPNHCRPLGCGTRGYTLLHLGSPDEGSAGVPPRRPVCRMVEHTRKTLLGMRGDRKIAAGFAPRSHCPIQSPAG